MAFKHGKNTNITVNSQDISPYCSNSELKQTVDTHDTTGYGSDNKTYIPGLGDGEFSCEGTYDDGGTSDPKTVFEAVIDGDAAVTVIRQTEGTGSGLPQESFSAICKDYTETNPVGDKIRWSAQMQITGAVTRSTQV